MKLLRVLLVCMLVSDASSGPAWAKDEKKTVQYGRSVTFDYALAVDGNTIDSSKDKGPITYKQGDGSVIPGLAKQMQGMKVGEEKDITVKPEDAYGAVNRDALEEVSRSKMPAGMELVTGMMLQGRSSNGQVFPVKIVEVKKDTVVLDHNHPLAGKTLNFHIKIVGIQ